MTRTGIAMLNAAWALAAACGGHEPGPQIAASDCEQCHLPDHTQAQNPVHVGELPVRCVACHATDAWSPEDNAGHDEVFPIFRGSHRGIDCAECHPAPAGFFEFACTDCHEHSESRMAAEHEGISGYRWESTACLRCHPEGD